MNPAEQYNAAMQIQTIDREKLVEEMLVQVKYIARRIHDGEAFGLFRQPGKVHRAETQRPDRKSGVAEFSHPISHQRLFHPWRVHRPLQAL